MKFFIICVSLSLLANNVLGKRVRIVGGEHATSGQFKYQVSVLANGKHRCGGGILDDTHVLTAAHCVLDKDGKFKVEELSVVGGVVDATDSRGVTVKVDKIFALKSYKAVSKERLFETNNDVAVLKLKKGLGLNGNPNLESLKLPVQPYSQYVKEPATVAGFGYYWVKVDKDPKTNMEMRVDGKMDYKLKHAKSSVLDNSECRNYFALTIHKSNLCARVQQPTDKKLPAEGTCAGDSGGPLVHKNNVVIGVLSWSINRCKEDFYPGVYSRVSHHVTFIENAMKDKVTADMRTAVFTVKKGLSKLYNKGSLEEIK